MKSKKNQTQTSEVQNDFLDIAEENLMFLAKNLNVYLKENKKLTLQEQNTVSAIIHKYTTSYTQLKSIEFKKRELYIKEQTLNLNFKQHDLDYGPFPFPKSPDSQDTGSPFQSTADDNHSTPPPPAHNGSYGYAFDIPQMRLPTREMIEQAEKDLGLM